jgi:RNA polymerase sigma-70 factor (ECF subfamily)
MPAASSPSHPDFERFRNYLRILAEIDLSPRLRSKVDASDIVQQSLLEAYECLDKRRGTTDPELIAWLRTILSRNLLNTARDYGAQKRDVRREMPLAQRVEQSSVRLEQFLATSDTTPSQNAIQNERLAQLADALAQLPDDWRTAVILKHFHDWPLAQIAEHMGRTNLAVAGLLKRGLKRLRELMAEPDARA